ncbi:MAG: cell wall hydrolase [Clostridia bacterium]|nr:cell wall hydrolase [Clostridia bacterium]
MIKKIAFIVVLIMTLTTIPVFAVDSYGGYAVPVDIAVNGSFIKCAQKPIMVNNSTYIPLRAFAEAIGAGISWDGEQNAANFTKDNHTFVFYSGKDYCLVDGTKSDYAAIEYKDLLFVPVRAVSGALDYGVEWDDFYLTVKISAPGVSVPGSAIDYSYTYEDILCLSKITHVESGYQAFRVKIGVANTVLNRVRSSEFPNTVKDVIFDTKYSVQFPPAHTDNFNTTPSKESVIAAKCALNGVNLVGNSLYFVDVAYTVSSWVHNNRPHYITIADMEFYQ